MNIKEEAKLFAINAHRGQKRKSEIEKPMIIHPLEVGNLLENWGFDDNVIAAGYLHDVVEDTNYTNYLIEFMFGSDVANLVYTASEPDKKLSWEERKKHTIEICKDIPLRNKAVICADKVSNLESLDNLFLRTGKRNFSAFKRGEDDQRWYYTEIYKSLVNGENEELEMFKRLKDAIERVFYNRENYFLKDMFSKDLDYYEKLKVLDAKKNELLLLRKMCGDLKPFVIEFTGTPRSGKTNTINALYDFFRKAGFNTEVVEEFTTSKFYKEDFKKRIEMLNPEDRDILIMEEIIKEIERRKSGTADLVLLDRGINDRQIWNYRRMVRGELQEDRYNVERRKAKEKSLELIDALVIFHTSSREALKRDYINGLSLEKREFLTNNNISEYNENLKILMGLMCESVPDSILVETTFYDLRSTELKVASELVPIVRKRYLKTIQKEYN